MAWSIMAVVMLAAAGVALAKVRQHRQIVTHDLASVRHPIPEQSTVPSEAPLPGMEVKPGPVKSCPVCLSEYPTRNLFCVRDGAELMEGRSGGPFAQGMICPTCRRGYPFDASYCPEDADALVPYGLYGAASSTRSLLRLDANKICPECGIRHAAAHLFCGHDGSELVVVN